MPRKSPYAFLNIVSLFIAFMVFLPSGSYPFETYEFKRMWPTLQQPWYFSNAWGLAVDDEEKIYVADTLTHKIQVLTSGGSFVNEWGGAGSGDGEFDNPVSIDIADNGNVYVADFSNNRIQVFTPDGQFLNKWGSYGSGEGQFYGPIDLAISYEGNVYVADAINDRIQVFTLEGQFLFEWGAEGTADGELDFPYSLAIADNGDVFVADRFNSRVQVFSKEGQFLLKWGQYGTGHGDFEKPTGIAIDKQGYVYVADDERYIIQKFTPTGQYVDAWGSAGGGPGEFMSPQGIIASDSGYVYVADSISDNIQVFTTDGRFVNRWGSAGESDGDLDSQWDVEISVNGNVYVVDTGNARIQVFSSDGQYLNQWGSFGSSDGEFEAAVMLGIASNSNVYVTEFLGNRVQVFTSDGQFVNKWGSKCVIADGTGCVDPDGAGPLAEGDGQFNELKGIAVANSGDVYVVDTKNNRVQVFTSDGQFINKWGSQCMIADGTRCVDPDGAGPLDLGDGQFNEPYGIAISDNGNIYVADSYNNRIQVFTPDGQYLKKWGSLCQLADGTGCVDPDGSGPLSEGDGQLYVPTDLEIGENGDVYVSDSNNARVQVFTKDGQFLGKFGSDGSAPGQLRAPIGLALSSNGDVFVSESANNRIQVLKQGLPQSKTKAVVLAGGGPYEGNTLWPATQMSANFAYRALTYQGLTKDSIYYLSSDTGLDLDNNGIADDVDSDASNVNLQNAITSWALDADNLVVYIVDHGGAGTFRMSGTETLSATDLDAWLDTVQSSNCTGADLLVESFEGSPAGWTVADNAGGGGIWRLDDPGGRTNRTGGAGIFAIIDSDHAGLTFVDTELRSPVIDLSAMASSTLEFKTDFIHNGLEIADVDISINGAAGPWTNVWRRAGASYSGPKSELIDISSIAAGESNVMIRFHYYNSYWNYWWQIDDVKITGKESLCPDVTVIYDACESGSFVSYLTPPPGKERVVITSTSPAENAYFVSEGTISFSNYFWTNVFNGLDLNNSFEQASSALGQTIALQTPLVDADGNGVGNEAVDNTLTEDMYIGNGTIISGDSPVIGSVSPDQIISGTASATLTANNVVDSDGIARVWAVVIIPDYSEGATDNPVQGMPSIDLMPTANQDEYEAVYDGFNIEGTYQLAIYARDSTGNTSIPKLTTVSVNSPLRRKAIIVAGGAQTDSLWPAVQKNAQLSYDTLKFQGYSDLDIQFYSPVSFSAGVDGTSTKGNLQYSIETWAASYTQDLVVYMVGNGGDGTFEINDTETLMDFELDAWIDNLQATLPGKVTVVYDASQSGSFISSLIPPSDKERILVASTGANNSAAFLSNGDISFSKYFWSRVLDGTNVRDSFIYAKKAILFAYSDQTAEIEDDGNGISNEKYDGKLAIDYTIGAGIILAGDDPIIGSIVGAQNLQGPASADIWVDDVTTTGTIDSVRAIITPPGYEPSSPRDPVTGLDIITLANTTGNKYEGTYNNFTEFGTYKVSAFAMDDEGVISRPVRTTVQQVNGSADTYENDDRHSTASVIIIHDETPQLHNFHDDSDADWVKFYGLAGHTYNVMASNLGSNSGHDVVLELYGIDGITRLHYEDNGWEGEGETIQYSILADGVYYVKVSEVNGRVYGQGTEYDLQVTMETAPNPMGILQGYVYDSETGTPLEGAVIVTSGSKTAISQSNGGYVIMHGAGSYTLNATGVAGYEDVVNEPFVMTLGTGGGYVLPTVMNIYMSPLTVCTDSDGDGYGNPGDASCTNGSETDCNDGNSQINPGATESCDGADNNCSGQIDEGYQDTDNDGIADCVDTDIDGDGLLNGLDTCPMTMPAKIGGVEYPTIWDAYTNASDTATIECQDIIYEGDFTADRNVTVTIKGGYNCDYSTVTGTTTVEGNMTVDNGKVIVENVDVKAVP